MILKDKCVWNPTMAIEKPVTPGVTIGEYGMLVMRVNNAGVESVTPVAGGGTEDFMGIALPDSKPTSTRMIVEEAVVPSAAPRTVTLKHANLVTGQLSVFTSAGVLVSHALYSYVEATGVVTFTDATYAGVTLTFVYRYTMTSVEAAQTWGQRGVNFHATVDMNSVTVITGPAEMWTDMVDLHDTDYVIGVNILYTHATGLITSDSSGGPQNLTTGYHARILETPNINSPFLGFRYQS